ncbi:hypothetical protein LRL17_25845 [Rhodococcus qingshengii]|uniref:DUF6414 family protein n=1 Tax=Rhodococcus qingshengii TaxID=334542 RepID=UPI001E527973|nr:hypothetical protein [Rhodococcus qingshengii]UGQ51407.1 hypothetical protein LRL17_25845 [Rhodococcus qingshengii]
MKIVPNWVKRLWAWIMRKKARAIKNSPFMEFVYLDEISVLSLLVSREGELTEQIQEGRTQEESVGGELGSSIGAKETSVSSKSSFQTKSSQSVQATRKASIQSQFKRLHQRVKEADLLFPVGTSENIDSIEKLLESKQVSINVSQLTRGSLIELEVKLQADPLFSMGSIITEVAEMSADHPEIFGTNLGGVLPTEMNSYGKLLDRFMAGLVPIRSIVTNVRLYEKDNRQYLVDTDLANSLGLQTKEIELVGVLEKDRFWKDMRRLLFSDATVTVLGRVSIDGIRKTWTPVKLLDLFAKTMPGGQQIVDTFQNISFDEATPNNDHEARVFEGALREYSRLLVGNSSASISDEQQSNIDQIVAINRIEWTSTESQVQAFQKIADRLGEYGITATPDDLATFRTQARTHAGITALGDIPSIQIPSTPSTNRQPDANLIEIEVVAMYW